MGHSDGSRIYRDAPGLVETTVVCDDDWSNEPVTLRFWHPPVTARFSSPLVDPTNLAISGDSHWRRIVERVARRHKPIGFVDGSRSEMEQALDVVRNSGGHGRLGHDDDYCELVVSIAGTVGSTFDTASQRARSDSEWQPCPLRSGPRSSAPSCPRELRRASRLRSSTDGARVVASTVRTTSLDSAPSPRRVTKTNVVTRGQLPIEISSRRSSHKSILSIARSPMTWNALPYGPVTSLL